VVSRLAYDRRMEMQDLLGAGALHRRISESKPTYWRWRSGMIAARLGCRTWVHIRRLM
jgi:hypothetical protein